MMRISLGKETSVMLRWLKLYVLPSLMLLGIGFFVVFKMWDVAVIFAISLLAIIMSPGRQEYPFFGTERPTWLERLHENVTEPIRFAISALTTGIVLITIALTLGFLVGVVVGGVMAFIIHAVWLVKLVTRNQGHRL